MATSKAARERNCCFCERVTQLTRFCFRCDIPAITRTLSPINTRGLRICRFYHWYHQLFASLKTLLLFTAHHYCLHEQRSQSSDVNVFPFILGCSIHLKWVMPSPHMQKPLNPLLNWTSFSSIFITYFRSVRLSLFVPLLPAHLTALGVFCRQVSALPARSGAVTRKTLLRTPFQMFIPSQLLKYIFEIYCLLFWSSGDLNSLLLYFYNIFLHFQLSTHEYSASIWVSDRSHCITTTWLWRQQLCMS